MTSFLKLKLHFTSAIIIKVTSCYHFRYSSISLLSLSEFIRDKNVMYVNSSVMKMWEKPQFQLYLLTNQKQNNIFCYREGQNQISPDRVWLNYRLCFIWTENHRLLFAFRPFGHIYIFNKVENDYVAAPGLYRWLINAYRDVAIRIAELLQSILGNSERNPSQCCIWKELRVSLNSDQSRFC